MRRAAGLVVALLAAVLVAPGPASAPAAADGGKPGTRYYYAAAYQYLDTAAQGFQATFTVEDPRQVEGRFQHHSLAQIGVGQRADRSQLEAGWIKEKGAPRLFSFWRPASGKKTCYNRCGFHRKGPGRKPGARLEVGSTVTIGYQHIGSKWWLLVDGKRSGFYPDKLWKGRGFTGTDYAQVFGEVTEDPGDRVCIDMGNGRAPAQGGAATISAVTWLAGPPTSLTVRTDVSGYPLFTAALLAPDAIAYGGPGEC